MNALDLPPRRPLPPETRERLRRSVDTGIAAPRPRSRAPLAVAACVAVLAVAAVLVVRLTPDGGHPVATTPPTPSSTEDASIVQPVTTTLPDIRTHEDLDRCGDVVTASPRAGEFAPRENWRPKFTATAPDGARITAFLGNGGKPAFCEVTTTTATVSDPTADWTPVAITPDGMKPASVFAVYLSPTGVLAGVATGMDALEFSLFKEMDLRPVGAPAFQDGMFVVNVGELGPGDGVDVIGRNSQGMSVVSGMLTYLPADLPPAGVSGPVS